MRRKEIAGQARDEGEEESVRREKARDEGKEESVRREKARDEVGIICQSTADYCFKNT